MDKKLDELFTLGALYEIIDKAREIVQHNGLVGGHRGSVDSSLTDSYNEVYERIEELKKELKL